MVEGEAREVIVIGGSLTLSGRIHGQVVGVLSDLRLDHAEIDGQDGVHFCGAYWSYGFHEDGVKSAQRVVQNIREQVAV